MIRSAAENDAAAIKGLMAQLGYDITISDAADNINVYHQSDAVVLVSTDNNLVIGFISGAIVPLFHKKESMFRITALCVDEAYRSKGFGKKLVNAIEDWCIKKSCFYIEVTSGAHRNKDAHQFYESLHYTMYDGKRFLKRITGTSSTNSF